MKPRPFDLELWLHLGKPDCIWTRDKVKIKKLTYHEDVNPHGFVLSGINDDSLEIWAANGRSMCTLDTEYYGPNDLMLHLDNKSKIPWIKKK